MPQTLYAYVPEPKDRANVEASTRTGMIAGLAGLAAVGSLALTTRTYRLTQQGQFADRYTKAIAQLGDDRLDVRLGGIYALERIAVDSKRDHPTVVEVLSAYVRERCAPTQIVRPASRRTAHPPTLHKQVKVGVDVQAALTVLGRLPHRAGVSRGDLSWTNLSNVSLARADLTGALFMGAKLTGASLVRAKLPKAGLVTADLTRADLTLADLTGAYLGAADLTEANLSGANLSRADLPIADLVGAELSLANLTQANLPRANLTRAKDLAQQQLDAALGDEYTKLPAGLQRPVDWC